MSDKATENAVSRRRSREYALICIECRAISRPGSLGWRIYLDCDGEPTTYCPWCAAVEFDDFRLE
jgi:hypothetical protein